MDLPIITTGNRHTKRSYSSKPLYTERYVQWCERTDRELIPIFLLDKPHGFLKPMKFIISSTLVSL